MVGVVGVELSAAALVPRGPPGPRWPRARVLGLSQGHLTQLFAGGPIIKELMLDFLSRRIRLGISLWKPNILFGKNS